MDMEKCGCSNPPFWGPPLSFKPDQCWALVFLLSSKGAALAWVTFLLVTLILRHAEAAGRHYFQRWGGTRIHGFQHHKSRLTVQEKNLSRLLPTILLCFWTTCAHFLHPISSVVGSSSTPSVLDPWTGFFSSYNKENKSFSKTCIFYTCSEV